MTEWGFLTPSQQVLHDCDAKFCSAFQETLKAAGVTPITLPPRSPHLNAHAERWVCEIREGGSPVTADPVWERRPPTGAQRVWHPLSSGTPSSGKWQ